MIHVIFIQLYNIDSPMKRFEQKYREHASHLDNLLIICRKRGISGKHIALIK